MTRVPYGIGTSEGLFMRPAGMDSLSTSTAVLQRSSVDGLRFFRDDDGTLYIGTNFSLFVYDPANNKVSLLPNTEKDSVIYDIIDSRIVSVIKDKIDGHPSLIVSPYGHYIAYYDLVEKQWVSRNDSVQQDTGEI